jgi:hypothetical protein
MKTALATSYPLHHLVSALCASANDLIPDNFRILFRGVISDPQLYVTLLLSQSNRVFVFFEALEKLGRSGRRRAPSWAGLSEQPSDEIVLCRLLRECRAQAVLEAVAAMAARLAWDTRHDRISIGRFRVTDARILIAFLSELLVRLSWLERSLSLAGVPSRPKLRNMENDHFRGTAKYSRFPHPLCNCF